MIDLLVSFASLQKNMKVLYVNKQEVNDVLSICVLKLLSEVSTLLSVVAIILAKVEI